MPRHRPSKQQKRGKRRRRPPRAPPRTASGGSRASRAWSAVVAAVLAAAVAAYLEPEFWTETLPRAVGIHVTPLEIVVETDRDLIGGPDMSPAFVFDRPLEEISSPPQGSYLGQGRYRWAHGQDAVDADETLIKVVVTGKSDERVQLVRLEVRVVSRRRPLQGTYIAYGPIGGFVVQRHIKADLDARPAPALSISDPGATEPHEMPIDEAFPRWVSRDEQETLLIRGSTFNCDCEWEARLAYLTPDGQRGWVTIRDDGRPFRTTSTADLDNHYYWDEGQWRSVVGSLSEHTASSGGVTARLSVYSDDACDATVHRLRLERAGELAQVVPVRATGYEGPLCVVDGSQGAVTVRDVDDDAQPEVIVDVFTGGANCCLVSNVYRWTGTEYALSERNWKHPGYRLDDLDADGRPEFVTADARFAYEFASLASSGFPLQVLHFQGDVWQDVTRAHPDEVSTDAARWMREYLELREGRFGLGVLAAWVADQYLLGRDDSARRFLTRELRAGRLRGIRFLPERDAYIGALTRRLRTWRYE